MKPSPNSKTQKRLSAILAVWALLSLCAAASEAVLHVEQRGSDVVLFITGGTSNVQYQVFTSPDNNVTSTNWYYWRHAYSTSFKPYAEMLVYGPNTSQQPRRFFQIRGLLPDAMSDGQPAKGKM